MGAVAVGASLAGGAMSIFGDMQRGKAEAAAAEYNATINRQNAQIATEQGVAAAEAVDRDVRMKIGSAIAEYGASGSGPGSGSALDVLAESSRLGKLDVLTTKYNYELQAIGYTNQANLESTRAKNIRKATRLNAIASGLKLAGNAVGMFGIPSSSNAAASSYSTSTVIYGPPTREGAYYSVGNWR